MNTKYIIITGGVLSGLGKGVTTASIGLILKSKGFRVSVCKIDPYLNVDPGLMNPYQHGEIWITKDGYEADLDFGHYERFLDIDLTSKHNITTGKIFLSVLEKERKGYYLGQTVQIIPHVTDEIKQHIKSIAKMDNAEILLVEIGGTVGDIEGMPFLEAVRQLRLELGERNVLFIHVTLVPIIKGEQKTKPTQHSVKELRSLGIQPDIIICRCQEKLNEETKRKISLYCNVSKEAVISNHDVEDIYEVPIILEKQGLSKIILEKLGLKERCNTFHKWEEFVERIKRIKDFVEIAIVGKYTKVVDSYISIVEALKHAGYSLNHKVKIKWVSSEDLEKDESAINVLNDVDGILVPGGFGKRGIEGKIKAIRFARENNIPFLGICLGFQLAVVEFARNVLNLEGANSTEFDPNTRHPVVDLMPEQRNIKQLGASMRLGERKILVKKGTLAYEIYKSEVVYGRHRHRYEVNPKYISLLERHGMIFSGISEDNRAEILELKNHRFFVATQYHIEFSSRPLKPEPVFVAFLKECINYRKWRNAVKNKAEILRIA